MFKRKIAIRRCDMKPKQAEHALPETIPPAVDNTAMEVHYKPRELAKKWGVSESTAVNMFANEPGVLRMGNANGRRRTRVSLRIPQSVAERVHARLCGVA
jgi:hypothetical protein